MNTRNTRKITVGGLLIALSVLLPQAFHFIGTPRLGQMLLPMHIPVLLGGFLLGPVFGIMIGAVAPLLSSLITEMPPVSRLPFMVIELAGYGFASGLLYKTFSLCKIKYGVIITLVSSMLLGRVLYALSLFIAADLLHVTKIGAVAAVTATVAGVYGIIVQFLFIPPLIYILKRSGYYDAFAGKGKNDAA